MEWLKALQRNWQLIGFVLMMVIFVVLYLHFYKMLRIPEPDLAWISDPANALELRWRMLWGLSAVALTLITVINGTLAATIMVRNPIGQAAYLLMFCAVAALVAWVVHQSSGKDFGGGASDAVLQHYSIAREIPVNDVVEAMVPLSGAVAVLVIMAAVSLLMLRKPIDADMLISRYRDFRKLLSASTAMLVIGVLQTYFLFRMATSGLDEAEAARVISGTLTIGGSTAYTVMLVLIFGPVAYALNRWSWQAAHDETDSNDSQTLRKWLQDLGIYNSPTRIMSQAMLASAPALVGLMLDLVPKVV